MDNNTSLLQHTSTQDILQDMRKIIEVARESAYQAVNVALVQRNWLLGRRIAGKSSMMAIVQNMVWRSSKRCPGN